MRGIGENRAGDVGVENPRRGNFEAERSLQDAQVESGVLNNKLRRLAKSMFVEIRRNSLPREKEGRVRSVAKLQKTQSRSRKGLGFIPPRFGVQSNHCRALNS